MAPRNIVLFFYARDILILAPKLTFSTTRQCQKSLPKKLTFNQYKCHLIMDCHTLLVQLTSRKERRLFWTLIPNLDVQMLKHYYMVEIEKLIISMSDRSVGSMKAKLRKRGNCSKVWPIVQLDLFHSEEYRGSSQITTTAATAIWT